MARELIKIKGGAGGFQLMIDSSAELADVQEELEKKLSEHPEFFPKGTEFQLVVADLSKSVRSGLKEFLTDKGLAVTAGDRKHLRRQEQQGSSGGRGMQPPVQTAQQSFQSEGGSRLTEEQQVMTVINRTVRNGEEITSQGSVMICGNVNPGAKIVAAGSIDVRGNCRGIVHAGAMGDYQAFVVADRLMAMQIRIANLIARSPDNPEKSDYAEKAYIKDGQIIIEPIER